VKFQIVLVVVLVLVIEKRKIMMTPHRPASMIHRRSFYFGAKSCLIRLRRIIHLKPTFKKNPAAGKSAVGGLELA
jgi:hypothetical protein